MALDFHLNDVQQEPVIVSASQTAALNKYYINVASATYTDPTPIEGKGFTVFVRNGTATVGGSAYAVAGTTIYRVYHSGAWANYTHFTKDYLDTIYKATFSENTAFNKNFGTTAGTVCEGNDSRFDKNITVASTVTTAGHTANTSETILGTPLAISSGSFVANDEMVIRFTGNSLGTAGTKEVKLYLNTVADLTGSPIQIARVITGSTAVGIRFQRIFDVETTALIKNPIAATVNLVTDFTVSGTYSTYTPDLTVTQYLIATGTLTNSGDTINLQSLRIMRNRV